MSAMGYRFCSFRSFSPFTFSPRRYPTGRFAGMIRVIARGISEFSDTELGN
jgi:hypothetical protein